MMQRLAWPLSKDDTQIHDAFHVLKEGEVQIRKKNGKEDGIWEYGPSERMTVIEVCRERGQGRGPSVAQAPV